MRPGSKSFVIAVLIVSTLCLCQLIIDVHSFKLTVSQSSLVSVTSSTKSTFLKAIASVTSQDEFDNITSKNTEKIPHVIDFQKSGCKPCIKAAPLYEALSVKYDGKAKFFKVDADSSKEALALMKTNGVRSVPTFHVWVAGTRIDTIQGAHVDEVESLLVSELKKLA